MAEAIALTSIAKSALQLFTSLAKDELLLLWNCGEDLEKLKKTIETISCFLQDAEEKKSKLQSVQLILSELGKVMYDAEDLFDGLAAYVLHKNTKVGNAFTKEGAKWLDDIPWRSLSSLQQLTLYGMEEREQLPDGIQHLTSLQSLSFGGWGKEVVKWIDDIPWNSLSSSLMRLLVHDIGERDQLPDGIQHLTSLNTLQLWNCKKVRSVPSWIPQLPSLINLKFSHCSEELERRCEIGRGEDWPLIRHIRYIRIENRNESRNEEASSRKMGWCGAFSLSKFY